VKLDPRKEHKLIDQPPAVPRSAHESRSTSGLLAPRPLGAQVDREVLQAGVTGGGGVVRQRGVSSPARWLVGSRCRCGCQEQSDGNRGQGGASSGGGAGIFRHGVGDLQARRALQAAARGPLCGRAGSLQRRPGVVRGRGEESGLGGNDTMWSVGLRSFLYTDRLFFPDFDSVVSLY
jgi:hypothetical protein